MSEYGSNIQSLSYKELVQKIRRVAYYLSANGVSYGQPIILAANQSESFICCYFALHLIGAIVVPIDGQLPTVQLKKIADKCSAKLAILENTNDANNITKIITFNSIFQNLSDEYRMMNYPRFDDKADVLFTTGTTGTPKGVILTHHNILSGAININNFVGNKPSDIELIPLPFSHSFGLARLRCNMLMGATIEIAKGFLLPGKIFRQFADRRITGFSTVPAGIAVLFRFGGDKLQKLKDELRYIEIGSAPMPLENKLKLMELLPNTRICMHYGLTEASRSSFIEFHTDRDFLNSVGKATPGVDLKIYNNVGNECGSNEVGEFNVRGASVAKGYISKKNILSADGWFKTGDIGYKNEEDYIFLTGRKTDVINIGGRKVSPIEIEGFVNYLPEIEDCACIGIPDQDGVSGEIIKLFLVLRKNSNLSSQNFSEVNIIEYLRNKLESYKIPSEFAWIDEVPKTKTGKIQRHVLRQQSKIKKDVKNS